MLNWAKILAPDAIVGVLSALAGAKLAEKSADFKVHHLLGNVLEKIHPHLVPDAEDVLRELLLLKADGQAIIDLLVEAVRNAGFVIVGGHRFAETWIIHQLEKVEAEHRYWVYPFLNWRLGENRDEFFALLEVMQPNGYAQHYHMAKSAFGQKLGEFRERLRPAIDGVKEGARVVRGSAQEFAQALDQAAAEDIPRLQERIARVRNRRERRRYGDLRWG